MAVHGSLLTMPLADLLQWVKTTSRSGMLTIQRDGSQWELEFSKGRVCAYSGPELQDGLGYIVVTSHLVDEVALRSVYQRIRATGGTLMGHLLTAGLVSQEQLTTCLIELVIESIYDLFMELPGEFVYSDRASRDQGFDDLEDPEDLSRLAVDLDVNMLLIEGARRHDEWEHVRRRFPDDDVPVQINEDALQDLSTLGLRERRIISGIRSGHSVSDVCFEMRTPIPAVLRILAQLEARGMVQIDSSADPKPHDQASRIQKLMDQAAVLRAAGQFDEAVALLEVAVRMRPDADLARSALKETLEEQIKALYALLPPVKVPCLVADAERIARLRLRPEERFLLERLSANMDIGALTMVSSMSERETLKALRKLLHSGIIELR